MPLFPDCPDGRQDCRFIDAGNTSTTMHSPVQFDRSGAPVGGGMNTIAQQVQCTQCGRSWACSQSELAWARGDDAKWEPMA